MSKKKKKTQFEQYMDKCEREFIKVALVLCDKNVNNLASYLNVSRATAFRLANKHGFVRIGE